jgi:hypothetical protein
MWHLPLRRAWALACTVALTAVVEVGLRLVPLARLARALDVPLSTLPAPVRTQGGDQAALAPSQRRWLWATNVVLQRWPFGDTCLRRALVLGYLLRRERPVLRIGVAQGEEALAHAWIETEKFAIGAQPAYTPLTRLA